MMNPRYAAYAREEHGVCPDEALRIDEERWPGGKMAGFMIWIGERWAEFVKLNPSVCRDMLSEEDHAAFDAWLEVRR